MRAGALGAADQVVWLGRSLQFDELRFERGHIGVNGFVEQHLLLGSKLLSIDAEHHPPQLLRLGAQLPLFLTVLRGSLNRHQVAASQESSSNNDRLVQEFTSDLA